MKHCLNLECILLNLHQWFPCPTNLLAYQLFRIQVRCVIYGRTAETLFNGFRVSTNWILLLISLCIFIKKDNTNRVSSSSFLFILTKFYIIVLLYRVLHFFFFVEIIQHNLSAYNFLLFSPSACFYGINYVLWIFPKTIGRVILEIKFC